jgi:hypothetical protein
MVKRLQLKRGTAEKNDAFTGANGEITVDLTNMRLRVHDGLTPGGFPIAKAEDLKTKLADFSDSPYHTKTSLTNLSQLTNDSGYWSKTSLTKLSQLTNDAGYITGYCTYCSGYCTYCTHCS